MTKWKKNFGSRWKGNLIENIIKNNNGNKSLSCSKIAQLYSEEYNKSLSRVTVYRILTKKLDYRFRKTAVKTNKLLGIESIKQTFFILKIIARIIKLGDELVFIDDSEFYNENNNLKKWRKNDEEIYFDITDTKKVNLILAVTQSKVVYYKITSTSTNEDTFKKFMEDLYDSLSFNERENYCFLLDNLSAHSTAKLFTFYKEKKMKILFNTPYRSNFNMVELVFRHIKRETYTHLYSDEKKLRNDITNILGNK